MEIYDSSANHMIYATFKYFTSSDVVDVWSRICMQRQNSLRDAAIVEQSMQIVLSHAHEVLNKRMELTYALYKHTY